ncbi:transposase [Rodentibacter caecimuris]|uniref:transposase n=1 Tax=Rodentibacter caecimuris TaxID=1796644 RepID=UPI003990CCD4
MLCERLKIERVELNAQVDHVHLLTKILLKRLVLDVMGPLKGRATIRVFNKFCIFNEI